MVRDIEKKKSVSLRFVRFPVYFFMMLLLLGLPGAVSGSPQGLAVIEVDSAITGISANHRKAITELISFYIEEVSKDLSDRFGLMPARNLKIRLLSTKSYQGEVNGPAWSSALYKNGSIYIHWTSDLLGSPAKLKRILQHEYVHAVVGQASDHSCPAWFDEGLALYVEGRLRREWENIIINWAESKKPMPLSALDRGFVGLPKAAARVAYAQSYLAVQELLDNFGDKALGNYINKLSSSNGSEAFHHAFGMSDNQFAIDLLAPSFQRISSKSGSARFNIPEQIEKQKE